MLPAERHALVNALTLRSSMAGGVEGFLRVKGVRFPRPEEAFLQ